MNIALEDSSKRLIKGKASQMSQRSRFCRSPLASQKGPAACKCCAHSGYSPLLRMPPGCSVQSSASPKSSSVALRFAPLCSQNDQTDRFGFLNVTGLAKEQRRVYSRLDIKIEMRRWVRAGRRGNSLPPGFGDAPEERSLGGFSFPRRKLRQCIHANLPPLQQSRCFPQQKFCGLQTLKSVTRQGQGLSLSPPKGPRQWSDLTVL